MAEAEEPTSPVRALRDAFGDRKLPDITRKITACVACRKQKIKCHMQGSQPPCTRCQKRGLSCTVNRSLQAIMESDVSWKHSVDKRMQKLEALVEKVAHAALGPEALAQLDSPDEALGVQEPMAERSGEYASHTLDEDSGSREIVMDVDSGPGVVPGFHVAQPSPRLDDAVNNICRNGISLENAQRYFDAYQNRLDHFPYRILGDYSYSKFDKVQESSPFLFAAACTVGALHSASDDFEVCYKKFSSFAASRSFSKGSNIDDVRALCIGAFWLDEISWTLVGAAVRMATELQLHRSFAKALQGDRSHYLRTRLYFQVYTCDHHFSVAYGRPPMTRDCEAIRDARKFVDCEHATEDDARLVSQVLRWSVCSNIYDTFGANSDHPFPDASVRALRRYAIALDTHREEWEDRYSRNAHVGNYPNKGVGLQCHFAKLYLYSHAFRGVAPSKAPQSPTLSPELNEIASSAVLSAMSILRIIIADAEVQSFLNGLPVYFDTMIAFAAVFLFKVSSTFSSLVQVDVKEIHRLMTQLVACLKRITPSMHPSHILPRITNSIDDLVHRYGNFAFSKQTEHVNNVEQSMEHNLTGFDMTSTAFDWNGEGAFDSSFMNEYDFFLSEDTNLSMEIEPALKLPERPEGNM